LVVDRFAASLGGYFPAGGLWSFIGGSQGCAPPSAWNSKLAAKAMKIRLNYGFVNEQRQVKGVIPLEQAKIILVSMKMVTKLWRRVSPCQCC
jgi:hypothetical protein